MQLSILADLTCHSASSLGSDAESLTFVTTWAHNCDTGARPVAFFRPLAVEYRLLNRRER